MIESWHGIERLKLVRTNDLIATSFHSAQIDSFKDQGAGKEDRTEERYPVKLAQTLGSIGLCGYLLLVSSATHGDASPYLTHQIVPATEPARRLGDPHQSTLTKVESPNPVDLSRQAATFHSGFEPGIERTLESRLTLPIATDPLLPIAAHATEPTSTSTMPTNSVSPNRAVPEPASVVLVITGLIGLAARRHLLNTRP